MISKKAKTDVTVIAADIEIEGSVRLKSELFVMGKIKGNVDAEAKEAMLTVSPEGRIEGEIRVPTVIINGTIEGNVFSSDRLEVAAGAVVHGDLHYHVIEMHLGAQVQGRLIHVQDEPAGPVAITSVKPDSMAL
jgi:cytoskeletal protein CcmA (bactofilin family)|tara:strand:+ start:46687 stop:47088 length:402 start_codon:yes stop_codon:yes gene_type:complete